MLYPKEKMLFECTIPNCGLVYGSRAEAVTHNNIPVDFPLPDLLAFRDYTIQDRGKNPPLWGHDRVAVVMHRFGIDDGFLKTNHSYQHRCFQVYFDKQLEVEEWSHDWTFNTKQFKGKLQAGEIKLLDDKELMQVNQILQNAAKYSQDMKVVYGHTQADEVLKRIAGGEHLVRTTPELDDIVAAIDLT